MWPTPNVYWTLCSSEDSVPFIETISTGLSSWQPQIPKVRQGLGAAGSVGSGWIWRRGNKHDVGDENRTRDWRFLQSREKVMPEEDVGQVGETTWGSGRPQSAIEEVWWGQGKWQGSCWDGCDLGLETVYPRACLNDIGEIWRSHVVAGTHSSVLGDSRCPRLVRGVVGEGRSPQGTSAFCSWEPSMAAGCGL